MTTDFFATPVQDDTKWDDAEHENTEEGEVCSTKLSQLAPPATLIPAYQEMLAAVGVDDDNSDDEITDGDS